jgi:hypothetical protein
MLGIARRFGIAVTAIGLAFAGSFVGIGSAGASDGGTSCFNIGGMFPVPTGSTAPIELHAWYQRECRNPERVTKLPVYIQRYNSSTGTWTTVVSGTGSVTYVCHFSTPNRYRWTAGSTSGTVFNCG